MAATRADINGWLDKLYDDENLTHMIVKMDWFDHEDYPVYVKKGEDVREKAQSNGFGGGGDRVMEVYSRNHTREEQMAEHRAFHYD